MQQSLYILNHLKDPAFELARVTDESSYYEAVYAKETYYKLPHYTLLIIDKDVPYRMLSVFNPITMKRTQLVHIYLSTYRVKVRFVKLVLTSTC